MCYAEFIFEHHDAGDALELRRVRREIFLTVPNPSMRRDASPSHTPGRLVGSEEGLSVSLMAGSRLPGSQERFPDCQS